VKVESWELSDELWQRVEPILPKPGRDPGRQYLRKPGAGRKPLSYRKVFAGIIYVLRTGCQWNALSRHDFGSGKVIHRYFMSWSRAGVFLKLWHLGLAEYNDLEGIAWRWQSIDGALVKAPLAQEAVGPNPTDRGKKWVQKTPVGGRHWHPVSTRRDRR